MHVLIMKINPINLKTFIKDYYKVQVFIESFTLNINFRFDMYITLVIIIDFQFLILHLFLINHLF